MPHDLDETRLAEAVKVFAPKNEIAANAHRRRVRAAIAAWEASAPKREPATVWELNTAFVESGARSALGAFISGVRWAESRQPRAEPKGELAAQIEAEIRATPGLRRSEPPRPGMTKAQLAGLLAMMDIAGAPDAPGDLPEMRARICHLAAAIRAETPDGQ